MNLHYSGFYRACNDYDVSGSFAVVLTEGIDNGASQPVSAKAERDGWGEEGGGGGDKATRDCNRLRVTEDKRRIELLPKKKKKTAEVVAVFHQES